eukprot:2843084-Amphidinium_carterae.1
MLQSNLVKPLEALPLAFPPKPQPDPKSFALWFEGFASSIGYGCTFGVGLLDSHRGLKFELALRWLTCCMFGTCLEKENDNDALLTFVEQTQATPMSCCNTLLSDLHRPYASSLGPWPLDLWYRARNQQPV